MTEELLPEVEKKTASDGRPIRLSKDPNDRAIGGASSGAICAFTAAWERPDSFRRVFSAVGTYVGLRGGNEYPTLIRKYEPKPLRVFLEDGSNDQNIYAGDWWMANQEMERALKFAGYEVNHAWGEGGHNGIHATEIFPDAMRWLWKDWPAPVKAGAGSKQLQDILIPGEDWTLVSQRLQVHRRSGRQRERRSLLQRHSQQQDVQDRPRRQGEPVHCRLEKGEWSGLRSRRPALRRGGEHVRDPRLRCGRPGRQKLPTAFTATTSSSGMTGAST